MADIPVGPGVPRREPVKYLKPEYPDLLAGHRVKAVLNGGALDGEVMEVDHTTREVRIPRIGGGELAYRAKTLMGFPLFVDGKMQFEIHFAPPTLNS